MRFLDSVWASVTYPLLRVDGGVHPVTSAIVTCAVAIDEQNFVFYWPCPQPVRDRYMDLFRAPSRSLQQFMWHDDIPE